VRYFRSSLELLGCPVVCFPAAFQQQHSKHSTSIPGQAFPAFQDRVSWIAHFYIEIATFRQISGGLACLKFANQVVLRLAPVSVPRIPTKIHLQTVRRLIWQQRSRISSSDPDLMGVPDCRFPICVEFAVNFGRKETRHREIGIQA